MTDGKSSFVKSRGPANPDLLALQLTILPSCRAGGAYRSNPAGGTREMSGRSGRIDRRWLPLNALRAFEMVGRHLSFTGAAQSMHVSQSALSRHVAMLEDLLGQPLLSRRPHGLALTEAGAALLPAIGKSFDRLEQVLNDIVRRDGRQRRLRVHM